MGFPFNSGGYFGTRDSLLFSSGEREESPPSLCCHSNSMVDLDQKIKMLLNSKGKPCTSALNKFNCFVKTCKKMLSYSPSKLGSWYKR